ncbi:hypothetical protein [Pseudomonas sp. GL-B-19]|uniref:hypothetical protein n=1 Tax=Pseudomonas sp. GL-B-19 TaxID=2832393 RepID=UPI001CBF1FC4|nr:hypothetical protein [Pseudomonas sp. GL-B-19]
MTRSYLTAEDAALILESGFSPMRCVAEHYDYQQRVRFQVSDSTGKPILTVKDLLKHDFSDPNTLKSMIESWRSDLAQRSFNLHDWSFP